LGLPAQSSAADSTRAVLQALRAGHPYSRWLAILDNADDIKAIEGLIPDGPGHVLITSTNAEWGETAYTVDVDVFKRHESIQHLTERARTISEAEANRIAEALGDLPVAVAAAGAWLAETGTSVDEYLRQIDLHGPRALVPGSGSDPRVEATWDL